MKRVVVPLVIVLGVALWTCKTPPLYSSDPEKASVINRIKIQGDSNHVEINYYWFKNDTIKRDSL